MPESSPSADRDTEPSGQRARARHGEGRAGPGTRTGDEAQAYTSPAAVFALVFGLLALVAALSGLLAPVAVLFGVIGIVLGVLGVRASRKRLMTGRGVAIAGLILAVLGTLVGVAAIVGVASVVSGNPQILDQITTLLDTARAKAAGG